MTQNLIVFSDTHCGCRLGLCPPDPIHLDGGGTYHASSFQLQMWEMWREFWDVWVPQVTRGESYDVVHNGDAVDGVHHNSTTQISHNHEDQQRIAELALRPVVERCKALGGTYYHIRGTEAHVGQSGENEERLARSLGAKPNDEGQYARFDLWKRVGSCLVHTLHHIGSTSSAAHETSAVNAELASENGEAARWGREPPDVVIRSHRHRSSRIELPSRNGYAISVVTAAWQGKTPFVWKIPGGRLSEPQFGGLVVRQGDEEFYCRQKVWSIDRSAEE